MKIFTVCLMIFLTGPAVASAQSMLEYATLVSATGAAGAAQNKDDEQGKDDKGDRVSRAGGLIGGTATRLYDQSMQTAAQRGGALLGQLGRDVPAGAKEKTTSPAASGLADGTQAAQEPVPLEEPSGPDLVKVFLRNGQVVEGRLVEQRPDYVRVESAGVVVTFFSDEISRVMSVGNEP